MAVSTKYGSLDIGKIGKDEPVFVIRARDELAVAALKDYRSRAQTEDREETVASVEKEIEAFLAWQEDNETKLPT